LGQLVPAFHQRDGIAGQKKAPLGKGGAEELIFG
jgi:hypothetical protein